MKERKPLRCTQEQATAAKAPRLDAFISAYIANRGNATQAAITAGYSRKTAGSQGCMLLKDQSVCQEIERRRKSLQEKTALTNENILRELARIVFVDPRKFFNLDGTVKAMHEIDDDSIGAISSIDVQEISGGEGRTIGVTKRIRFLDKVAAIEKAMKHLGMLVERKEVRVGLFDDLTPDERLQLSTAVRAALGKRQPEIIDAEVSSG